MAGKSTWVLALLIGLLPATHAAERSAGPVGTWQLIGQNQRLRIEFLENGEYRAITRYQVLFGKWSLVDQTHLATWSNDQRPKRINAFRVEGETLFITDRNGVVNEHRRVE